MRELQKARQSYAMAVKAEFEARYRRSQSLYIAGRSIFPNGVSQLGRMLKPFPPFFRSASGCTMQSVDDTDLIDYWAGHFCMIFGHNPPHVIDALHQAARSPMLLQIGVFTSLEAEVARKILDCTGGDQVLFSTSGALSTMYAIMLACAATKRQMVVKIAGGWHGVQPWSVSGVRNIGDEDGRARSECGGIPTGFTQDVIIIPFNDVEAAERAFSTYGPRIAACIAELVLGNSGMVVADPRFVRRLRELCTEHGSALILDEIVTGFRVNPGGMQQLYQVQADISTYGKALAGGMPFACIVGSQRFMSAANESLPLRVWADAGTFTSHPGTLLAVNATLDEIKRRGGEAYEQVIRNASDLRDGVELAFNRNSVCVEITGRSPSPEIPSFPISTVRFITDPGRYRDSNSPLVHWDSRSNDVEFRNTTARLALILKGIFSWQGLGVVTAAHTPDKLSSTLRAYEEFASEIKDLFPTL